MDDAEVDRLIGVLGYDVASKGTTGVWVRSGAARQRYIPHDDLKASEDRLLHRARVWSPAPAYHGGRHEFADGRSRWVTHGKDRADQPCLQDYACPEGEAAWPKYVRLPDGRRGPAPFESASEQRDYEQLTGQRAVTPDERRATPKRDTSWDFTPALTQNISHVEFDSDA